MGRGGEEGGKCKQGTRTYGVTGLFWEVPGWGGGQSTRRLRECRMWGEWEIGTWGKEERMGVVKEPNKTWTSGNGEECNPPRPLEKKKKSQGWGKMTKSEEMKTFKHTESSDLMRPLKMLQNKQHLCVCVCVCK